MKGLTGTCINVKEAPHKSKEMMVMIFQPMAMLNTMLNPKTGIHRLEMKNKGITGLPFIKRPSGNASAKTPKKRKVIKRAMSSSLNPFLVMYKGRIFMNVAFTI
jgi:hypothetical protein